MSAKDSIATQTCKLSKNEFNDFPTLYAIPSEYRVILPKSNQTVFYAPPGLNPFGCAKITTFVVMCKAYGCEPSVELGWHELFLYVQDSIIPAKYSQLLFEQNKLDSKSFKDKLPPNIKENPMFQCLGRYPTSVCVFPDPILFLAGFKPSWEHGQQRPTIMAGVKEVMTDSKEIPKPKVFVVYPGSVAARIKDRKCKTRGWSSRPPVKRKLAPRSSTSRATRAKTFSSKDDVPFMTVLMMTKEDECEELQAKCVAAMTEFEKNPTVMALWEKISTLSTKVKEHKAEKARLEAVEVSLWKEVKELNQDRGKVVSKVVPYATMELVHIDYIGSLVGGLVSPAILYGRYKAYEQVADMKEPFNAPIKALLSKKPPSLQRPAPSRTQVPLPSSQRATLSLVVVSNLMSPPVDVSVVKP
nr:hypothetical protein [Tanacetum cinerariifolium]